MKRKSNCNLCVIIKDGRFVSATGLIKKFKAKEIEGAGWTIKIDYDGSIVATAKECSSKGQYLVKTVLKPGTFVVTKQPLLGGAKNAYVNEKIGTVDGILTLSGNYENRSVYHDSEGCIEFMKEYGITNFERMDPNKTYKLPSFNELYAETPTRTKKIQLDFHTFMYVVEDSSWVLIEDKKNKSRILYSLKPYEEIELPIIMSENKRKVFISRQPKEFENLTAVKKYITALELYDKKWYEYTVEKKGRITGSYSLNSTGSLKVYIDVEVDVEGEKVKYRIFEGTGFVDFIFE